MNFRILFASFSLFIFGLATPEAAFGQDAVPGLGMSPTSQELKGQPGTVIKQDITVINDGPIDLTYTLSASDYTVKGSDYSPTFTDASSVSSLSAAKWFSYKSGAAVIRAHDQVVVPITISVPANASLGGHYAAVFAETVAAAPKNGSRINRITKVGSLFYLAIGGNLHQAGAISKFSVPWLQYTSPIQAKLLIKNSGNIHFSANSKLIIKPLFGNARSPVLAKGEVLPGIDREFDTKLPAGRGFGIYRVNLTTDFSDVLQPEQTKWVLLIPKLAAYIFLTTIVLILAMMLVLVIQKKRIQ